MRCGLDDFYKNFTFRFITGLMTLKADFLLQLPVVFCFIEIFHFVLFLNQILMTLFLLSVVAGVSLNWCLMRLTLDFPSHSHTHIVAIERNVDRH